MILNLPLERHRWRCRVPWCYQPQCWAHLPCLREVFHRGSRERGWLGSRPTKVHNDCSPPHRWAFTAHHSGDHSHDEDWRRKPVDFGEVEKQGGDASDPDCHELHELQGEMWICPSLTVDCINYIKVKRKNNLATKEQIPTAWFLTVVGKSSAVYK